MTILNILKSTEFCFKGLNFIVYKFILIKLFIKKHNILHRKL